MHLPGDFCGVYWLRTPGKDGKHRFPFWSFPGVLIIFKKKGWISLHLLILPNRSLWRNCPSCQQGQELLGWIGRYFSVWIVEESLHLREIQVGEHIHWSSTPWRMQQPLWRNYCNDLRSKGIRPKKLHTWAMEALFANLKLIELSNHMVFGYSSGVMSHYPNFGGNQTQYTCMVILNNGNTMTPIVGRLPSFQWTLGVQKILTHLAQNLEGHKTL